VKYVVLLARLIIGGLFVYASIYKIADPAAFSVSIRNYLVLPPAWSNLCALTLPWIEVAAGSLLIVGILTKPSALLTTGMLGVFLGAIIYAYSIGLNIDCGCFSSAAASEGKIGWFHIFRDSALCLTSLVVLVFDRGNLTVRDLFPGKVSLSKPEPA
jgi:putative oxidoreductase